ncbi:MAG: hypothetical protein ABSG83_02895 [Roseiarcus sp.]|jgi:uncharacterized membrane protein
MTDIAATSFSQAPERAPTAISLGDVFSRSMRLFASRWPTYCGLALVGYVPFAGAGAMNLPGVSQRLPTVLRDDLTDVNSAVLVGAIVVVGLAAFAWALLAWVAGYALVSHDIAGSRLSVGQALGAALRRSPAVVGLTILGGLAGLFASLLFLIPGVIVFCMFAVAIPACLIERLGPVKSLSRSAYLTKGNRWRVLGLILALVFGVGIVCQLLLRLADFMAGPSVALLLDLPVQAVSGALGTVVTAALYFQLRAAREGVAIEQIARVFD